MEQQDVKITIIDRDGVKHEVEAPTDMAMNLMEVVRAFELAPEGTIGVCGGMAMCASCQCYVLSDHELPKKQDDEEAMFCLPSSLLSSEEDEEPRMDRLDGECYRCWSNRPHSKED